MRLMLHIFRKDARRLWYEIAVTLAMLALLARWDCWRSDAVPSRIEGWLNLLLPVGWGYLVLLLIHGEALVGDRQFWVTRPYRWPALLGAKFLFALVFIHIPSFLADCAIVTARGFEPLECLSVLVWKQVLWAASLTIPAAALAVITRNLPQFMTLALVTLAIYFVLTGAFQPRFRRIEDERRDIPQAGLVVASAAVVLLQYARRRTVLSRGIALGGALTATLLFLYLPRHYPFALRCALSQGGKDPLRISIDFDSGRVSSEYRRALYYQRNRVVFAVPVRIAGADLGDRTWFQQLELEIRGPEGRRWKTYNRYREDRFSGNLWYDDSRRSWQILTFERSFVNQLGRGRVTLAGIAFATRGRECESRMMPILGAGHTVAGVGRCTSMLIAAEDEYEKLKVVCESPFDLPRFTRVNIMHPATGREWKQGLGDSGRDMSYPTISWLSPVSRGQTFFYVNEEARSERSRWSIPREDLAKSEIHLVPWEPTGCAIVRYELRDIDLSAFEVKRTK